MIYQSTILLCLCAVFVSAGEQEFLQLAADIGMQTVVPMLE